MAAQSLRRTRSSVGVNESGHQGRESKATSKANNTSDDKGIKRSSAPKKIPAALKGKLKLEQERSQNDDIAHETTVSNVDTHSDEPQRKKRRVEHTKATHGNGTASSSATPSVDPRYQHIGEKYSPGNGQRDYVLSVYM